MNTQALQIAVLTRTPVLIWGPPGVGKTETVKALISAMKLHSEIVIASIREPSDFGGLPYLEIDGVKLAPPDWAKRLAAVGDGVLVFDEINSCSPATMQALLRVVLERVVGDCKLPPDLAVIAMANPPERSSGKWDLTPELANRFLHLQFHLDAQAWAEGMIAGWPAPKINQLPVNWERSTPQSRSLVAAFIHHRPGLLLQQPTDESAAGRAWPSPRSWEMAARLIAACIAGGVNGEVRTELLSGSVGEAAALEYFAWVEEQDLPDPLKLLEDPDSERLPERGDRLFAALGAVVAMIASAKSEGKKRAQINRWNAGWRVLARAAKIQLDVTTSAARGLASLRPQGAEAPEEARIFTDILKLAKGAA